MQSKDRILGQDIITELFDAVQGQDIITKIIKVLI